MTSIQTTLSELVTTLRGSSHMPHTPTSHSSTSLPPLHTSSPHFGPYAGPGPSPTAPSPSLSNHSHSNGPAYPSMGEGSINHISSAEREYTPGSSYPMSQSRGPPPGHHHHHHRSHSESGIRDSVFGHISYSTFYILFIQARHSFSHCRLKSNTVLFLIYPIPQVCQRPNKDLCTLRCRPR